MRNHKLIGETTKEVGRAFLYRDKQKQTIKLIKISDTHYIVVDDSEIKDYNTFFFNFKTKLVGQYFSGNVEDCLKKIIYSTLPLENGIGKSVNGTYSAEHLRFDKVKQLSLSEVEEALYGYSVEKMAMEECEYNRDSLRKYDSKFIEFYKEGFKAHQELAKDKLFTVEYMKNALSQSFVASMEGYPITSDEIIQSLLPKTEWDVKFNEQGKIELA